MSAYGSKIPVTGDTEIYYDLHLYGDDLYELVVWLETEFGVQLKINLRDYGPGERVFPFLFRKSRERREREQRPYKSLKISDVLAAVDAGHLPV